MNDARAQGDLQSLIQLIDTAPTVADGWSAALRAMADWLDCACASLMIRDSVLGVVGAESIGLDADQINAYMSYYHDRDPVLPSFLRCGSGAIRCRQELVDESAIRRTEFYNDYVKPNGMDHACGVLLEAGPRTQSWVFLTRPASRPEFDSADRSVLEALLPHLHGAVQRHLRQACVPDLLQSFPHAVERLSCGVIIVDRERWILYANPAARTIIAQNDGLCSRRGVLELSDQGAAWHLDRAASREVARSVAERIRIEVEFSVPRPSGELPYRMFVSPVIGDAGAAGMRGSRRPAMILFVEDLFAEAGRSRNLFQIRYGLTNAETEVIGDLVAGRSLEAIAARRMVSVETVRTQLKSVYRKTDTTSQPQLVALYYRVTRLLRLV